MKSYFLLTLFGRTAALDLNCSLAAETKSQTRAAVGLDPKSVTQGLR